MSNRNSAWSSATGIAKDQTKENAITNYDVNHLTELQKNPLIKRSFTKIQTTATQIFVSHIAVFGIDLNRERERERVVVVKKDLW